MVAEVTDGRRRKGQRRRRLLVEATMRLIERGGLAAVSQRAVAQEAGVPPSAVMYYFPTVDNLLVAALVATNDDYLLRLDECARSKDPLTRLAALIAGGSGPDRSRTAAEYELFLMAARRPDLRHETARWTAAVEGVLAPHLPDPIRRSGVAAAVDGLFLRSLWTADPLSVEELRTVLDRLVH
jgi:DNA-binding transcriptional regulator YbjK